MNHLRLSVVALSLFFVGVLTVKLEGGTVTGLSGGDVTLVCTIIDSPKNTTDMIYTWNSQTDLLFFNKVKVQALTRMSAEFDVNSMEMTIHSLELSDEGKYICKLQGLEDGAISDAVDLIVNQLPQSVSVENIDVKPMAGTVATIAKCYSNASKPEVTMWFTDDGGNKIDDNMASIDTVKDEDTQLSYSVLSLQRVFYKLDNRRVYYCNVEHTASKDTEIRATAPVNVQYLPTAYLSVKPDDLITLEEGTSFSVTCQPDGNPTPTVTWTFTANDKVNATDPTKFPENFVISSDGSTIKSDNVELTSNDLTNNGTFTCSVSNGLGSEVVLAFDLGVYVVPTTVASTTTASTTARTEEAPPIMEPRTGGSDAAVIGGVVAVALFVLIVAIVLIVRYFMAHKGTYRTNEQKVRNVEENRGDSVEENRAMMTDDDDENGLVEKKRPEYFM